VLIPSLWDKLKKRIAINEIDDKIEARLGF
jgi:hypothetical protein